MEYFDVVVIGGGPAGSATALSLSNCQRKVLLLDKIKGNEFKVGEGLHPAAKPLLEEVGVWKQLVADGHLPCYGNESAWGSHTLLRNDFIFERNGHGWHLDRARFDASLRELAYASGVTIRMETRLMKWEPFAQGEWQLFLNSTPLQTSMNVASSVTAFRCKWVVDCSGRVSLAAKKFALNRRIDDQLVGHFALFECAESDEDSLTLIEAVPDGWWYTVLLPSKYRIVIYFTDAGTNTAKLAKSVKGFSVLLDQTHFVRSRLKYYGYTMATSPKGMMANSSRLEQLFGNGWLVVGDAANTFDPLSSQGIQTALYTGLKAGKALNEHLSNRDNAPLEQYVSHIDSIYNAYLQNRNTFYGYEQRWPENAFWKKRHSSHHFGKN
jgi:2-polyprenyl-6-methoxyphenol hydroxylase-like FAD-dependent oxidoreductase